MAICKIIPIKQARGISDCKDYIADEKKVISIQKEEGNIKSMLNSFSLEAEEEEIIVSSMDFHTVLAYMKNEEKTKHAGEPQKKYISGYLCDPETAVQEFLDAKEKNLSLQGKRLADETGNWAYHIIQSFPEGLNISDDEVHECGRQLCEKLGAYQAVICSHVHPVINEEGEVSGRCKHNHILINSHMHPDKLDPKNPKIYKYHNCTATYTELQKWNDAISLEHGLPIIRNPELNRNYSWFKSRKENEGTSWTKQVAKDIKNTMRFCSNWEEFKKQMTEQGYLIREAGKTITYYSPEHTEAHKQQIREKRLGREYTKSELERYWNTVGKAKEAENNSKTKHKNSQTTLIENLIKQYGTELFAEITIKGKNGDYTLDVMLKNPRRKISEQVLNTYFESDKTYNLCTTDHVPIAQVTGQDLFDYYEKLQKEREKQQKKNNYKPDREEYFYDKTKIDYKNQRPYKIHLWDANGRRRTTVELICILAMTIIKREHVNTDRAPTMTFKDIDGNYVYAKTDWKLQNMYNTMVMAREMNIETGAEVNKKMDRAGKEVARKRKQFKSLSEQYNQMETINDNIAKMESVKGICDQIYNMPDGEEKDAAMIAHAAELEQYKTAKRYLHTKNINTDDQITDFKNRFASVSEHLKEVETDLQSANEEYRKLKKINYNLTLAQNNYYCYGPTHPQFAAEQQKEETNPEQQNINLD